MRKQKCIKLLCFILTIYTLLGLGLNVSAEESKEVVRENVIEEASPALSDNVKVGSRFLELLFGESKEEKKPTTLVAGGGVFGVKIRQRQLTVIESVGVPALRAGDRIISINGHPVSTAEEVKRLVQKSGGNSITVKALHLGEEIGVEIRPTYQDGEYRIGLTLRDGAAGLGTVTFIDPETGFFGGLGHGICDADSGEIVSMESGDVCGVVLGGIHRGESGKPGELCGILTNEDMGDLTLNSECGVFGIITDKDLLSGDRIYVADRSEIREGEAKIISTIKNGKMAEYTVEIYDIDKSSDGSKSFRVRVTDKALIALTGGIVRGMSGSPIIQDGKLIGAVTHVLVADPKEGYGIFIDNMLNAAENTVPKAA